MKKVLFFQWNAWMQRDVEEVLLARGDFDVDCISYEFKDWDKDECFERKFPEHLLKKQYDLVFSINFFPVLSDVCGKYGILYVSWVYDAPMNIRRKETLKNPVNRIFVFDRGQYRDLREEGYDTVYHMPLGVNTKRLDAMHVTEEEYKQYSAEVSFVGQLYDNDLEYLMAPLTDVCRNRLIDIIKEQMNTYDKYILKDRLTKELIDEFNKQYMISSNGMFQVKREELEYACAAYITQKERTEALKSLSETYAVNLYSNNKPGELSKVNCKGVVRYYSEMPKVFRCSDINLNISLEIIKEGVPLRVFDILGAGGFLITNYQKEIEELFEIGKDLVVYKNIQDLKEKVKYYLEHEDERILIAKNGHDKVAKMYSVEKQIDRILREVENINGR